MLASYKSTFTLRVYYVLDGSFYYFVVVTDFAFGAVYNDVDGRDGCTVVLVAVEDDETRSALLPMSIILACGLTLA